MGSPKKQPSADAVRIGVFVCHCGSNIAGYLDCEEVTRYAQTLPGVVYATSNLYTCSESGIGEIQKAIKQQRLNRVVVASCSPRTHEPLFRSACAEAGLNPYLFEMANIRDQCSWVHMQHRDEATAKAKDLVRMAVAKAAFLEPLKEFENPITRRAAVIGGGIAGLSAAENLADMGIEVVLVEQGDALGGLTRELSRLAPYDLDPEQVLAPLIEKITRHPMITVYSGSRMTSISGYIGAYQVGIEGQGDHHGQEQVGCIIVATGAVAFTPDGMYGYDGSRVITQKELETVLQADDFTPRRVVMIQCVGARSEQRPYCSRICCMTAVKNARRIKERSPETDVRILYRDMQMYGTEHERMLWDARAEGIRFHLYNDEKPPQVNGEEVLLEAPLLGEEMRLPFDLLVLSTPLVPPAGIDQLAQLMRLPMDANGFFLEAHAKLRPLDFAADGIFLCGSARYPCTAWEARTQGLGAASRAATVLFKDKLVTSALVAEIDAETCVGCQGCIDVCPYGAISFDPGRGICQVNTVLCKGCGNCAATCPSQSAQLKGFKPQQLLHQIRALCLAR